MDSYSLVYFQPVSNFISIILSALYSWYAVGIMNYVLCWLIVIMCINCVAVYIVWQGLV